jgi:SAM-dependent methyltransferase
MLLDLSEIQNDLGCPGDPGTPVDLQLDGETVVSAAPRGNTGPDAAFPIAAGQPVLIDFSDSIIDRAWYDSGRETYSQKNRGRNIGRTLKAFVLGTSAISRRNYGRLAALLRERGTEQRVVLMVGAGAQGMGADILYDAPDIGLAAFDIYPTALTQFVADAHRIPLRDACVDAVCIQAVLEHVLDPARVVREIERVLKPGGLVYAETPFMQQVHEGAHDFTRFSELGHRWLFRGFAALDRGAIGGPGLSVYWSMQYLLRGLTRSGKAAKVLALPFSLVALLDRLVPRTHTIDAANGVYFLGRKADAALGVKSLPSEYLGAQK